MAEQKQTLLRQEPQNGTGQAFRTGTPESAGIPSEAVEWLLDELESGFTEPHGIMIMRNDILCAEGYWSPFAPGVIHGEQSHSKTYAATGIGIAYTEGLLSLDERLIDIFPEYAPAQPSENLKKLTIRNVLRMSCGMEKEPAPSKDWIRDFLAEPVVHEPGTAFMYNSTGSSMLAAIVRKKTGMGLHDYLNDKLYRKIGIDGSLHRWMKTADGIEIGGGGLFATLRDNFRLMKLYADGGVWNGERILAEDFVKEAVSKQIDTASEAKVNPPAFDNFVGYGYQIWQCQPAGVYRADGAMVQIDFWRSLGVTFVVTFASVVLLVLVSSFAAWGMVRAKSKFADFLYLAFTAAMLIPFQSLMYPLVNIAEKLGVKNLFGLIIMYGGFGVSMSIFLYHGFFKNIPISLEESAMLDGANIFQIYGRIVMPLIRSTTVTVVVINAMWIWNDYLLPFLVIGNSDGTTTLTLELYFAQLKTGQYGNPWELIFPAVFITIIPIIVVYIFLQKWIMQGVIEGAVKG